jgi:putative ATP-dependent endonuclease of OLD family
MRIAKVSIENFRGISSARLDLRGTTILLGDNNSGKTTVLEAIELALGADRLARRPVIDEHDFHGGRYLDSQIVVEVTVVSLDEELASRFRSNLEYWDLTSGEVLEHSPAEGSDAVPCVRVRFIGAYSEEDDDFVGKTWFVSPMDEDGAPTQEARSNDKRAFGFLLLRALRTGNRAMSMERGSLLDVVLRTFEVELKMWENLLERLRNIPVAGEENPEFGAVLSSIDTAMKEIVASEWADAPHLRVSELTRDDLRRVLRSFMATGVDGYAAPFNHQGSGTINSLVIAMLSLIAGKRDGRVIFAMEEPEISVPPTTQKRVVDLIRGLASQSIFTTHSPYVLEEFSSDEMLVVTRDHQSGDLSGISVELGPKLKAKAFHTGIRTGFCEALLARRVLVTEGATEAAAYSGLAKASAAANPDEYARLDTRGWAILDAGGETNVAQFAEFFRNLGKQVAAVFDQQPEARRAEIEAASDLSFEQPYPGFEELIAAEVPGDAQRRFVEGLIADGRWPAHFDEPSGDDEVFVKAVSKLLKKGKGDGWAAELLAGLNEAEFPVSMTYILKELRAASEPPALRAPDTTDEQPASEHADTGS